MQGYDVGRQLGKGSFGSVYEARCRRSGQLVAVKLVTKASLEQCDARQRLIQEVQIHSQLKHAHILGLHEFFEDEEHVYLVMDLCARGDMLTLVRQQRRLSEPDARRYFAQLVDAVSYLHTNSVLHRDIKLANILLTEGRQIKLADFGLATTLASVDSERQTICGTPNYLSPEIVSQQPYSFATDLWSLGVALYAMLTGTPPFQDSKVAGTLERVRSGQFDCPAYLSNEAADLIRQLLQRDAQHRLPLAAIKRHPFLRASRGNMLNDSCASLAAISMSASKQQRSPPLGSSLLSKAAGIRNPAHPEHLSSCPAAVPWSPHKRMSPIKAAGPTSKRRRRMRHDCSDKENVPDNQQACKAAARDRHQRCSPASSSKKDGQQAVWGSSQPNASDLPGELPDAAPEQPPLRQSTAHRYRQLHRASSTAAAAALLRSSHTSLLSLKHAADRPVSEAETQCISRDISAGTESQPHIQTSTSAKQQTHARCAVAAHSMPGASASHIPAPMSALQPSPTPLPFNARHGQAADLVVYQGLYASASLRADGSVDVSFPPEGSYQEMTSVRFGSTVQCDGDAEVTLRNGKLMHIQAPFGLPETSSQPLQPGATQIVLAVQYAWQCRSKCLRLHAQAVALQQTGVVITYPVTARSKNTLLQLAAYYESYPEHQAVM